MEPLYDSVAPLPGAGFGEVDGHFGYRVYHGYIEYIDNDSWTGVNDRKIWSHQEFYKEFYNQKEISPLASAVIKFLVTNKLVTTLP
jgi:hypothetical protein